MTMTRWMQTHRRSILFLLLVLAVGGVISSRFLPVALFPQVYFPRVVMSLEAGDRAAERMAIEVTWPVEEAVRAVPGGLRVPGSDTLIACAAITVSIEEPAR